MKFFALGQKIATLRQTLRKPIWWGVFLVCLIIGAAAYLLFFREPKAQREARQDFDRTIKAVDRLYEMPAETPVLATVTEKEKLASQPFFDIAENGDKVLVFNIARKVILYRPRTKKIINFSNLNPSDLQLNAQLPDTQAAVPTPTPTPDEPTLEQTETATVVINNGTTIAGLTQKVQQKLQSNDMDIQVTARANAGVNTYAETLVIPLTPNGEVAARSVASALSARVDTLPANEIAPAADILIIAGADAAAL